MEYTYCRCLPIETEIETLHLQFCEMFQFQINYKGEQRSPSTGKVAHCYEDSNTAAAPFEQEITDSFRDTTTLAKICSRT